MIKWLKEWCVVTAIFLGMIIGAVLFITHECKEVSRQSVGKITSAYTTAVTSEGYVTTDVNTESIHTCVALAEAIPLGTEAFLVETKCGQRFTWTGAKHKYKIRR